MSVCQERSPPLLDIRKNADLSLSHFLQLLEQEGSFIFYTQPVFEVTNTDPIRDVWDYNSSDRKAV